mmetsp:Transcript_101111/g.324812  ORF Transcript_101111/g.324812 Transcript_101111/m.324812 type:complete len:295 (+) Transcript_101111:1761-2645(+)
MPEAIHTRDVPPLARLRVVHGSGQCLVDVRAAAAHDQEPGVQEDGRVLKSRLGRRPSLRRCLYPIPSTVTVLSKAPNVLQGPIVRCSPAKDDHHARRRTLSADLRRVVDPRERTPGVRARLDDGHLVPLERRPLNIEHPDVALSLLAVVAAENYQQWLVERHGVTISAPGRRSQNRHGHPLGPLLVSYVEQKQLVGRQTATARGAAIYDHLRVVDTSCGVRGPSRRNSSFGLNSRPRVTRGLQHVGVRGDRVPTRVTSCAAKEDDAAVSNQGGRVTKPRCRDLSMLLLLHILRL